MLKMQVIHKYDRIPAADLAVDELLIGWNPNTGGGGDNVMGAGGVVSRGGPGGVPKVGTNGAGGEGIADGMGAPTGAIPGV